VRLRVIDFGPGIPADEQRRIFERFYRGKSAETTRARGSGIGLSLVRHIVESHRGTIRVKSPLEPRLARGEPSEKRPDGEPVGTAFEITLPRTHDHLAPDEPKGES
jgi:signal transduction histidine kinase